MENKESSPAMLKTNRHDLVLTTSGVTMQKAKHGCMEDPHKEGRSYIIAGWSLFGWLLVLLTQRRESSYGKK